MTKVSEELVKPNNSEPTSFRNGGSAVASCETSSGSDSDNAVKTASESSCSSVASSSSGTTTKLAARMADKVSLISSPPEKRFKFDPNEDYLNQLLAMGISLNGAKKVSIFTTLRVIING